MKTESVSSIFSSAIAFLKTDVQTDPAKENMKTLRDIMNMLHSHLIYFLYHSKSDDFESFFLPPELSWQNVSTPFHAVLCARTNRLP
jgi:hypothetical protein